MADSQNPTEAKKASELRGLGKNYQGAAIRWRDFPSDITSARNAAYQEIVLNMGFRLFIMGVEVTPHVMGSVSVDRHGRDGVNSLSFTLDNNFNKFVYTNWNLGGDINLDSEYYGNIVSTSGKITMNNMVRRLDAVSISKMRMEDIPKAEDLNWYLPDYSGKDKFIYDEVPKRDMYDYKSKLGIKSRATGDVYKPRYDLTPGACIINLMDHVRYFTLDPNEDNLILEDTMWKPEYTGFVASASVAENPITGESTIAVTCQDIRHIMRKMRFLTNTNDASILSTLITFEAQSEAQDGVGIFNDLLISNKDPMWTNVLAGCTADAVIRAVTVGENVDALLADKGQSGRVAETERAQDKLYPLTDNGSTFDVLYNRYGAKLKYVQDKKNKEGIVSNFSPVGTFGLGLYKGYDPPEEGGDNSGQIAKLEEWMDLLNFGLGRQWMTYDDVTAIGQLTRPSIGRTIGATNDQSPFSALNGFVHILCPGDGLSVSNIWDKTFITFDGSPNMSNRMEVLEQMCNTIDYQIQVNTMGDLMFEFPMYDFYPEEFGKYKYTMAWSDSLKHYDYNDEGDGNPVTGLRVSGGYSADDEIPSDDEWIQNHLYSVFVLSNFMASKYGPLVEDLKIPWANKAWGTGTPGDSTEQSKKTTNQEKVGALASFGIIEFTKRIAKMSSMSLNGVYCPFLWPNKPILNRDIRRMGLINSVNTGMQINGICTTGIGCEYIRKADNEGVFLNICGAKNTPFSYANNKGLAVFPNMAAIKGDKELPFMQNGDLIYTYDNGFNIEIIEPSEADYSALAAKYGINGTTKVQTSSGPVSKKTWSDPQKVYNKFRTLSMAEQDKMNALANKLCGGDGSLRGWQIYQYMLSESGYRTNNPNPMGGANGLIQFMPATLIGLANSGALQGAPKGLNKDNTRDRAVMAQWFIQSQYCNGPNATLNQLDLTAAYMTQITHGKKVEGIAGLNRYIFLPGAHEDTSMSFHDPRQPKSVYRIADKISAANGGVDSLDGMMRLKGFDTSTPIPDAQLEQNRLAGVKGSVASAKTPVAPAQAAPAILKTPASSSSTLYVASVKAPVAKKPTNIIDKTVSSIADPIFGSLGTGITAGIDGYANEKASDSSINKAITSGTAVANDATNSALQGVATGIDENAKDVKVWGYHPLSDGLKLGAPKPGVTVGK